VAGIQREGVGLQKNVHPKQSSALLPGGLRTSSRA
jgi:hypothetical protein